MAASLVCVEVRQWTVDDVASWIERLQLQDGDTVSRAVLDSANGKKDVPMDGDFIVKLAQDWKAKAARPRKMRSV